MSETKSREIHLKKRPVGLPSGDNFEMVEKSIPQPSENQVLVRNIYMSVDPYMRGRMTDRKSYVPPFKPGHVLEGDAVGQVVESRNSKFKKGDHVHSMNGWREYFLSDGKDLSPVDPDRAPVQAYLSVLGLTGLTAYVGLLHIAELKEGENVFVSAASGAVGSTVCQIAKIKGCRVAGSAGSDEKIEWLKKTAGVDAAINYKKTDNLSRAVGEALPDGIDVYYENVGGEHLEAALDHMNPFGRIAACGMISIYNATDIPPGPRNIGMVIPNRLTIKGFIVRDHMDKRDDFYRDMGGWIKDGRVKWEETIVDGIENAPQAFIDLFKGKNLGKMLVNVGDE